MRKPRAESAQDVLTVEQVAEYLQLNKMTVYKYIREGKLPASRIGKSYRVRKTDLAVFLEVSRVRPARRQAAASSARPASPRQRAQQAVLESRPVPPAAERHTGEPRTERPGPEEITGHPLERVLSGLH